MLKLKLYFFLLFLFPLSLPAQKDWTLKKDKSGIRVYTRPMSGSFYKEFRGEAILPAPAETLAKAVLNIRSYPDWMPNARSVEILEEKNGVSTYYLVSNASWPATDRDGIFSAVYKKNGKVITLEVVCLPEYLPKKKGKVRVQASDGFWRFTPLPGGKTKVLYQLHFEPGGNIPAWLAASSVVNVPYDTLKALRTRTTGFSR